MQRAGLHHLLELALDPDDLFVDGAPVGLDLGLAGAADEAETAALAFQVGPGADEAGALVAERGHLHLQHALAGARPVGEDFQDQPGPVEKLDLPRLFQVALLHRRHRPVDQDKVGPGSLQHCAQLVHLAGAEQVSGPRLGKRHDGIAHQLDARQGGGQRNSLFKGALGIPPVALRFQVGMEDKGTGRPFLGLWGVYQSSPS